MSSRQVVCLRRPLCEERSTFRLPVSQESPPAPTLLRLGAMGGGPVGSPTERRF